MISFQQVTKKFAEKGSRNLTVLDNIDVTFPNGVNVGILGGSRSGKTTLINLASGSDIPVSGKVVRGGRISWPFGIRANVSSKLTGRQNLRFLTDIYGRDYKEALEFTKEFSELGRVLDQPLKRFGNEQRSRFVATVFFAMDFEHFLVDETFEGGDRHFKKKCGDFAESRLGKATMLILEEQPNLIERFCQVGGILHKGKLTFCDSVQDAIKSYKKLQDA
jgi:capsular polysaccharide transport system ATP-binding protein